MLTALRPRRGGERAVGKSGPIRQSAFFGLLLVASQLTEIAPIGPSAFELVLFVDADVHLV